LCRQVRATLFFAHVRAATGTATMRANCHPFVHGRWMFMHNGQIGGYAAIRRRLEALLPDALYQARSGTTDSEIVFLLILSRIEAGDPPVQAAQAVLGLVKRFMAEAGVKEPLRFAAALADGDRITAFRAACDARPPTLYVCERPGAVILASEPLDEDRSCWRPLPRNAAATIDPDGVRVHELDWLDALVA
jgi:predicted glutamine amidotransferase